MNKIILVNLSLIFTLTLGFISCNRENKSNIQNAESKKKLDTIIVKHKNDLNKSYEVGFYSKSYSYYWLVGNDTLDFIVIATELEKDSTLSINIQHKQPILFSTTLNKIKDCIQLIKNDFYLTKLSSIYFKAPIFYPDLAKELSIEYDKQFGQKDIIYEELNPFLLKTKMKIQLDNFLSPFDKKVKRFDIEKFHLMYKKYYGDDLPNIDFTAYPDFTINGMGLDVKLENEK